MREDDREMKKWNENLSTEICVRVVRKTEGTPVTHTEVVKERTFISPLKQQVHNLEGLLNFRDLLKQTSLLLHKAGLEQSVALVRLVQVLDQVIDDLALCRIQWT